ncbi:MAG TPA: adenosylcobinamide-GDP ribazoletransferase, partial [Mycobacteriales bacterium]
VPGHPWQGPLAVVVAALTAVALTAHTTRRLSGVTGDVLGAVCESGVLAAATVLALS